jgi:hypothetical protein
MLLKDPVIMAARDMRTPDQIAAEKLAQKKGIRAGGISAGSGGGSSVTNTSSTISYLKSLSSSLDAATVPATAVLDDSAFGQIKQEDDDDDDVDGGVDGENGGGGKNVKDEESDFVQSFALWKPKVEEVRKRCTELDYPLMEEYDFRRDDVNPDLEMDLSPKCMIVCFCYCLSRLFQRSPSFLIYFCF